MRNRAFDFNKIPRSIYTVTLKDEKKLLVLMPSKAVFEKLKELDASEEKQSAEEVTRVFSGIIAEILSNNKTGSKIKAQYINDNYDIEEMTAFINDYKDFIGGLAQDPN